MVDKRTLDSFLQYATGGRKIMLPEPDDLRSEKCPHVGMDMLSVTMVPDEYARMKVEFGEADYCWDSCKVTDCPSYKAGRAK